MLEKLKSRSPEAQPTSPKTPALDNSTPSVSLQKADEVFKSDKPSSLEKKLKQYAAIAAEIKQLQSKEKAQARKNETRRKILAGSYILNEHEKAGTLDVLKDKLDKFLDKPADRKLFGLGDKQTA